jgi:hypothetical protein
MTIDQLLILFAIFAPFLTDIGPRPRDDVGSRPFILLGPLAVWLKTNRECTRRDANKMWEDKGSILAISTAPGTARAIVTPPLDANFVCIYSRKFASIRGWSFCVFCAFLRPFATQRSANA